MQIDDILLLRMNRQYLFTPAEDELTVLRDLCGLQAQFYGNCLHALRLRCGKAPDEDILRTSAVKTWTLRGTLHLIAQSDLKDLGVHTEMYVDAFVDIAKAGKITGARKQLDKGRQVYAFGAGTQKMYDYLNDNPECMSAPVDYTNDIRSISALDNFISINNAVDIDLFGQVNAETAGLKHISGAGGQLDFVLGAYLSKGGKSFICLSSTFFNKKTGQIESRIRPTLENGSIVTDTRANIHYLCTEFGCVNLKGLTTWEKAEALINVAHPDFREDLIKEAEKMHIWRRSNKI